MHFVGYCFVSCLFLVSVASYNITDSAFSQLVATIPIGVHFTNLTIQSELYQRLRNGTLDTDTFKSFIQQHHLYVHHFYGHLKVLAEREKDPKRVTYLKSFLREEADWERFIQPVFVQFGCQPTTLLSPTTLDYSGKRRVAARHDDLGVALATLLPCFTVWRQLSSYWRSLGNETLEKNPYRPFIERVKEYRSNQLVLDFIDKYYTQLDSMNPKEVAVKQRMIDAYLESVELEYRFAVSILAQSPIPQNVTAITYLTPLILPGIQQKVVDHPLYDEIARGILPLEKYKVLIQQDYLYMRGFYGAFEYMERKEEDLERKVKLRKNGKEIYDFFDREFKSFNFGPAAVTAPYTQNYIHHETTTARNRPIAEGLAGVYPCYYLWLQFGRKINEIARNLTFTTHPYQSFLNSVKPEDNAESVKKFQTTLSLYYDQASLEGKYRILQTIRQSIFHELEFANGIYGAEKYF